MAKENFLKPLLNGFNAVAGSGAVNRVSAFIGMLITSIFTLDANHDSKVTWIEVFNKIQVIGLKALVTFPGFDLAEFKQGLAELKTDSSARKQLIDSFAEQFELSNREAEYLLEDFLRWLEQGVTLYNRLQAIEASKNVAA